MAAFRAPDSRKHCCDSVNIDVKMSSILPKQFFCKVTVKAAHIWNAVVDANWFPSFCPQFSSTKSPLGCLVWYAKSSSQPMPRSSTLQYSHQQKLCSPWDLLSRAIVCVQLSCQPEPLTQELKMGLECPKKGSQHYQWEFGKAELLRFSGLGFLILQHFNGAWIMDTKQSFKWDFETSGVVYSWSNGNSWAQSDGTS